MKKLITAVLMLVCAFSVAAFASCTEKIESSSVGGDHTEHVWEETGAAIAATCETPGKTATKKCSVCGETTGGEEVAALGHDFVVTTVKVDPDCEHKGAEAIETCTRCSATRGGEEIDALGHDFVVTTVKVDPDCEHKGAEAIETCTRCKATRGGEEIAALGHDEVEHAAKAATCTDIGWEAYVTCSRCDYTTYKEISALDHDLVHHDGHAATCTEKGWKAYDTCSRCDYTTYEEISALDHDLVHHDGQAATCTEKGWKAYDTCSRCDYTTYEEIAALGHNYEKEVIAPTCVENGYNRYSCSRCDSEYTEQGADATGVHTWDKDKSCTEDRKCTVCGTVEKAEGHNYIETVFNATCEDDGYTSHKCSVCGDEYVSDETEALGHTPTGEWAESGKALKAGETCVYITTYTATCSTCKKEIVKTEETVEHTSITVITVAAKCNAAGYKQEKCSVCGAALKDAVEYTDENAHKWGEGEFNQETGITTYTCEYCNGTKTVVTAEGTNATVSKDSLSGNGVELKGSDVTIAMDSETIDALGEGDVKLSAETLSEDDIKGLELSDEQKARIGDKPIYNFTANDGKTTEFGGKVTVTVPYELGENEDVDSIVVWYIDAEGKIEEIPATYTNGYATFETTHFSYYTVTKMTPAERCEKFGHSYNTITVAATCTEGGYTLTICMRCGAADRTAETLATGHDYELAKKVDATCVKAGYEQYKCKNCDRTYKKNIPAAGHDFELIDSKASTCTETGYNEYKCGACEETYKTVIAKIAHEYEIEEKAPTCVESGYKKYTCVACGDYYIIDIAPTGIHTYENGVCTVCGGEEPEKPATETGFFTESLISLLENGGLKIAIPGVTVCGIPTGRDSTVKINVDELYLDVSKAGITGYGKFDFIQTDFLTDSTGGGWILLKDGVAYVTYKADAYSGYSDGNGRIDYYTTVNGGFAAIPLKEAFLMMTSNTGMKISIPVDEILPMLPTVTEWIDEEVLPLIKTALIAGGDNIEKYVGGIVNALFEKTETEFGYTFVLSGEKVAALIDLVAENTVAEVIDEVFGEGTFEEITEILVLLVDMTVGDIVAAIDNSAVTIDDILSAADALVNKMTGADGVDAFITMMSGQEMSVKDIIYGEQFKDMRLVELAAMAIGSMGGGQPSAGGFDPSTLTKETVAQMVDFYGHTRLITGEAKEMAAGVGEMAKYVLGNIINLGVSTDKDGKILFGELSVKVDDESIEFIKSLVPEEVGKQIAELRIDATITLGKEQSPEFDYESALAEYSSVADYVLTEDVLLALGVKGEDIVTDENGNVVSFRVETVTYSRPLDEKEFSMYAEMLMKNEEFMAFSQQVQETFGSGENMTTTFEMREVTEGEYTVRSGVVITSDCGSWLRFQPNVTAADVQTVRVFVVTVENADGVKLEGEFEIERYNSGSSSFSYYYNTETGEVEPYAYTQFGKHEFEEDETRFVDAVGCTGVGERYFICKNCGGEMVEYFTNGHSNVKEVYELAPGAETCYDGVVITRTCGVCGDTISEYTTYDHRTDTVEVDLAKYGLCGGYIREEKCLVCGEVMYSDVSDWECKWEYVTIAEDGTEEFYCPNCKTYKYTFRSESAKGENCIVEITSSVRYVKDGKEVYSFGGTTYDQRHNFKLENYEMHGKTCSDGVEYYYVCSDCGQERRQYTSDHYMYGPSGKEFAVEKESVDLADYGSVCGGTFKVVTCPCGEVETYYIDCDCHFQHNYGIPLWIENAYRDYGYNTYEYACSVTDPECGFKYREAQYWVKSDNECMAYEYKAVDVYDKRSDAWVTLFNKPTGESRYAHNYEYKDYSYEENGLTVDVNENKCPICGSYETEKYYYSEDGQVRYEYARYDEQGGYLNTRTTEYIYENGYRYVALERCSENRKDYEYRYENKYMYDFAAGCVCTRIYTNSDGAYEVYNENCHQYTWEVIKKQTCTQYGLEGEYCPVCGQQTKTWEIEPACHDWYYNGNIYVCGLCGLENANGASGDIVFEDLTEEYGRGEEFVIGYYQKSDGAKYMTVVSIVPHVKPEDGDGLVILASIEVGFSSEEYVGYHFSKAEVFAEAQALGYDEGGYDVRFAFVPFGGDLTFDYAITLTDVKYEPHGGGESSETAEMIRSAFSEDKMANVTVDIQVEEEVVNTVKFFDGKAFAVVDGETQEIEATFFDLIGEGAANAIFNNAGEFEASEGGWYGYYYSDDSTMAISMGLQITDGFVRELIVAQVTMSEGEEAKRISITFRDYGTTKF